MDEEKDLDIPPGPDTEEIRSLSRSFQTATIAIDGFHPRHVALIGDEGLGVKSGAFTCVNILGNSPAGLRQLI
eukprot:7297123-Pyramimonas_sp.AAC.1